MAIDIKFLPSYTVLAVRYAVAANEDIFHSVEHASSCRDLLNFFKSSNMAKSAHPQLHGLAMLNRNWNHPKEEAIICDECVILPTEPIDLNTCKSMVVSLNSTFPTYLTSTPAGTYAVFRHKGPYDLLPAMFRQIFSTLLPTSGVHYAGGPVLELYVNDHETTPEDDKEIDVCVPVTFGPGAGMASVPLS